MTRWYRAYVGTVSDDKIAEVAMIAGASHCVVVAVWHSLLESAAADQSGGRFSTTPRRVAATLRERCETVEGVFAAMAELRMVADGAIIAWKARQFESDNSTERSRKHRKGRKSPDATLQGRDATPPYTDTETDTETEINPPLPITAANGAGGDREGEGFFKTVWEGFPKDLAESEPLARQAFCELNARDQSEFAGAIRSIASHIAKQKLTRPYNLAAFIRDRRFAGFRAAPTAKAKRVKIAKDSPQGRAFEDFYRQQKGKGVPWQDDAWWFDSEWPPGHGPPIAQGLAS